MSNARSIQRLCASRPVTLLIACGLLVTWKLPVALVQAPSSDTRRSMHTEYCNPMLGSAASRGQEIQLINERSIEATEHGSLDDARRASDLERKLVTRPTGLKISIVRIFIASPVNVADICSVIGSLLETASCAWRASSRSQGACMQNKSIDLVAMAWAVRLVAGSTSQQDPRRSKAGRITMSNVIVCSCCE